MNQRGNSSVHLRGRNRLAERLQALWRLVREISGDDAYERYLRHCAAEHPGLPSLSRRAFFKEEQTRKWNGVNRCC